MCLSDWRGEHEQPACPMRERELSPASLESADPGRLTIGSGGFDRAGSGHRFGERLAVLAGGSKRDHAGRSGR